MSTGLFRWGLAGACPDGRMEFVSRNFTADPPLKQRGVLWV